METTDTRSIKQVAQDVAQGAGVLVREEIALLRAEMSEKASALRNGALALSIGGTLAFAGLLFLLQALTLALNLALEALWLSSAIVGLVVVGTGGALLLVGGKKISGQSLAPERTMESVKRDKEILDHHVGASGGE